MATSETQSVPSDLFPHVYSFLLSCQLHKTAKILKRECELVRRLTCVREDGERGEEEGDAIESIIDCASIPPSSLQTDLVSRRLVHTIFCSQAFSMF